MVKKIVFLGSDGSGKSSLINYTRRGLARKGKTVDVFFMGWKNFRNPLLRFFSRIYIKKKGKVKEEKLARFRSRSWRFYFVYYSELWLRYLNVLFSRKDYVLMDRYFYDELAFANGGKFKFLRIFTPKPDLCFVLRVSSKTLEKRGVNISKERLELFYNRIYSLSKICKIVKLDNSKKILEAYKIVEKYL